MSNNDFIKNEMKENMAMQEYLKKYSELSVSSFIDFYAFHKGLWLQYGKQYVESQENESIKWVTEAAKHLCIIQQKKLFDAQCLWRAEKLEIKEVEICYDFQVWEDDILNCPFLEPISEDDVTLYTQYLLSENVDIEDNYYKMGEQWQDHKEIIEAYNTNNENRNFPEWYDFYNGRRGTGVYMTLPDLRCDKEAFYMNIARSQNRKEHEANNPTAQKQANEPIAVLNYFDKYHRDWFVSTFENKEVKEYYKAFEWSARNDELKENLEFNALNILYSANEPVPIEANSNWAKALKKAAEKYTLKKIAEALPEAWEQYMMNVEMKIAFPEDKKTESYKSIRKMFADCILKGRVLNGEPEDFNF